LIEFDRDAARSVEVSAGLGCVVEGGLFEVYKE